MALLCLCLQGNAVLVTYSCTLAGDEPRWIADILGAATVVFSYLVYFVLRRMTGCSFLFVSFSLNLFDMSCKPNEIVYDKQLQKSSSISRLQWSQPDTRYGVTGNGIMFDRVSYNLHEAHCTSRSPDSAWKQRLFHRRHLHTTVVLLTPLESPCF